MQQENLALLAKHPVTSAAERRALICAKQFITPREGLRDNFATPLLPERPRKRPRESPDDPTVDTLADRLYNE